MDEWVIDGRQGVNRDIHLAAFDIAFTEDEVQIRTFWSSLYTNLDHVMRIDTFHVHSLERDELHYNARK